MGFDFPLAACPQGLPCPWLRAHRGCHGLGRVQARMPSLDYVSTLGCHDLGSLPTGCESLGCIHGGCIGLGSMHAGMPKALAACPRDVFHIKIFFYMCQSLSFILFLSLIFNIFSSIDLNNSLFFLFLTKVNVVGVIINMLSLIATCKI